MSRERAGQQNWSNPK